MRSTIGVAELVVARSASCALPSCALTLPPHAVLRYPACLRSLRTPHTALQPRHVITKNPRHIDESTSIQ